MRQILLFIGGYLPGEESCEQKTRRKRDCVWIAKQLVSKNRKAFGLSYTSDNDCVKEEYGDGGLKVTL
jgi:hypothetical protein